MRSYLTKARIVVAALVAATLVAATLVVVEAQTGAIRGLLGEARPIAGFPNDNDTGVPAGTTLTAYSGACTITTANTVIDSKTVDNCPSGLVINASGVSISKSRVNTSITTSGNLAYSLIIQDSEVNAGAVDAAAVGSTNLSLYRNEITGGKYSVACSTNCALHDNWLHGQRRPTETSGAGWALAALFSSGPPSGRALALTAVRNTLACDLSTTSAGGCTTVVEMYGASGAITQATIQANLIRSGTGLSTCLRGGDKVGEAFPTAAGVTVRDNVFERGSSGTCASSGPATGFDSAGAGNVWAGNTYDNGTTVSAPTAGGSTPSPTGTAPAPSTGWPDATNTGVPSGTVLTNYTGSCVITTDNIVISAKTVNCVTEGVSIQGTNVQFVNSKINGIIRMDPDNPAYDNWTFSLTDSEVDGGAIQQAAICCGNMDLLRVNAHGGQTGAQCEVSDYCTIQDSWLHGQYLPPDQPWHLGGFLSDGTAGSACIRLWCIELIHNTIHCDHAINALDEGCSGDVQLIPNFAKIQKVRIFNNYLRANTDLAYCTFGGDKSDSPYNGATEVVYRDNVFERGATNKCGAFGPWTDFNINGVGNVWVNNTYDDGVAIPGS